MYLYPYGLNIFQFLLNTQSIRLWVWIKASILKVFIKNHYFLTDTKRTHELNHCICSLELSYILTSYQRAVY